MKIWGYLRSGIQRARQLINLIVQFVIYRFVYGKLSRYIAYSRLIPGWTTDPEAIALAQCCYKLPVNAVVVEIGSFLGGSAVLFAGARKLRGSGKVHCVDPFDASGDAFSAPYYHAIAQQKKTPLRHRFNKNINHAFLTRWIQVHEGTAETIAAVWHESIDLLFLDGDQSPEGVRASYESWQPFIKDGGIIAIHNSSERVYAEGHDGHRRLVLETIKAPQYSDIYCVGSTTFARKNCGA